MPTGSILKDINYQFRYGNMVLKLLFVNFAVYLAFSIFYLISFLAQDTGLHDTILNKLETPASINNLLQQPWSIVTYMFLHTGFFHVLFNMLWFYWFGTIFV